MSPACSPLPALFDHMSREHGRILTDSELTEIVLVVERHRPVLALKGLEDSLVRHGVIQPDAIDDAEGYDGGRTRDCVLKVYEDITAVVRV